VSNLLGPPTQDAAFAGINPMARGGAVLPQKLTGPKHPGQAAARPVPAPFRMRALLPAPPATAPLAPAAAPGAGGKKARVVGRTRGRVDFGPVGATGH
jgi:hypothetical protein